MTEEQFEDQIKQRFEWLLNKLENKQKLEHAHLDFLMELMEMSWIKRLFLGKRLIIKYLDKHIDNHKLILDVADNEKLNKN